MDAPVEVSSTSTSASAAARSPRRTARPPVRSARATAVSQVRLAMVRSVPALASPRAMASPISPAPSTSPARSAEPAEALGGHGDGGLRDRGDVAADGGVGAGPLAGFERVAEEQVEGRAGGALLAGPLPRLLHLAEDLALAEHRRVEAGGDAEEVGDRRRVVVDVEVVGEVLGGEEGDLGEEVADVLVGAVEPLGDRVDLGAVAGGEHHGLGHVRARDQVVQRLRQRGIADGHALEQVERRAAVVQPDDDDGHAVDLPTVASPGGADRRGGGWLGGAPWPRRGARPGRGPASPNRGRFANRRPRLGGPRRAGRLGPRRAARRGCRRGRRPARRAGRGATTASAGLWPPVDTVTSTRPLSRRAGQRVRAARRVVGGVDPHPGRLAVVEHRLVGGGVVGAGHRQPVAGHLAALVGALLPA